MYVVKERQKGWLFQGQFIEDLETYTYNNAMEWVKSVALVVPEVAEVVECIRPEAYDGPALKTSLQVQIINEVERYLAQVAERVE